MKKRKGELIKLKYSQRKIAKEIDRSRTAVQNYIMSFFSPVASPRKKQKKKISVRCERQIIAKAVKVRKSCKQIKNELSLDVSPQTIYRTLISSENIVFKKFQAKPPLTEKHKDARFDFALEHIIWEKEWSKVIFSDEKKFNLDGPDGFRYFWHDLRKEEEIFSKRVQGGGSVMIWAGFCATGKSYITFVESTMNSQKYVDMLQSSLVPFANEILGPNFIFQQDNAPCHRAKNTKLWFLRKGIEVMEWPARSPDLNPIENLWGILARKVYQGGKQYNTINELKTGILLAWDLIKPEILTNLISSMRSRMTQTMKARGGSSDY